MSLLIKNALAVTMNGNEFIKQAYILTQGNTIAYIGQDCPVVTHEVEVIDAKGGIVLPGLVNAHTHLSMSYFRSFASDLPLDKWLEKIWVVEDKLDEEALYYGTLLACAEAMESGTACVNDMYLNTFGTAQACVDAGIRAYVSRSVVDTDGKAGLERRLQEQIALYDSFDGLDERIYVIPSAHAEYTCSCDALRAVYDMARYQRRPVHIHISETNREAAGCRRRHDGASPLGLLRELGLLEMAPTLAAHCVTVSNEDIDIMTQYPVYPLHNPTSNLKLGSGISPVKTMLERGVCVALGTDGNGSNNNVDMFRELLLASLLQKGYNYNAQCLPARNALQMATINGARALGYNGGCLAEGMLADILILRPSAFLQPMHDVYGILAYSAGAKDVCWNIINGRVTVREGQCTSIDKQAALAGFTKCVDKLFINS